MNDSMKDENNSMTLDDTNGFDLTSARQTRGAVAA